MILEPGGNLEFTFENLPLPLHSKANDLSDPACLRASLPDEWNPHDAFPILVHLQGYTGGNAFNVDTVRKTAGNYPHICVTMPLFKKHLDPEEVHGGIMLSAHDDFSILSRCYKKMLGALFHELPHVDPSRSAFGGFSNGAHATAVLLSGVDPFLLRHFQRFFFLDGGFHIASLHKTALRQKKFVYFIGGLRRKIFRRQLVDNMTVRQYQARKSGLDFTVHTMPGIEHAFPDEYLPTFREYVLG
ncbi:MAG: hypothetical protein ACOCVL_02765 [Candidatus Sumerlaeota bacterium]